MMPVLPASDWRPCRADGLALQRCADETLVLDRTNERLHRMNTVGADVLAQCDGERTTEQIIAEIEEIYDVSRAQVRADVNQLLLRLRALELVR